MNVDVGCVWEDPGTTWQYPGTGWRDSEGANRVFGKRRREQCDALQIMGNGQKLIEEIMAVEPVEANEHIFPLHPVPKWAEEIMKFMSEGSLPNDETKARRVQRRSKGYTIINKELYKRSTTEVLQRCVDLVEGRRCSWRYTKENVAIIAAQEPWWLRCSDMDSTDPLLMQMQRI